MSELRGLGRHARLADEEFPTQTIPVITEPERLRSAWLFPVLVLAVLGAAGGWALLYHDSTDVRIGVVGGWIVATALVLLWNHRIRDAAATHGKAETRVLLQHSEYQRQRAEQRASLLEQETQQLRAGLAAADEQGRGRRERYTALLSDLFDDATNRWPDATPWPTAEQAADTSGEPVQDDAVVASIARLRELLSGVRPEIAAGSPPPGIAQVMVDIGRRTQDFTHRAIEELDELIHQISDPALLRNLWAIDHLLSRLRRVSENLILIEGPTAPRQWRQPVTLLSVLRQAKAEIDQYERVQLVRPVPGTILGHVVVPLAHLVAELLENGAAFSKPETPVKLSARRVTAGIAVSIDDEGFGLTDAALDRANDLLRSDIGIESLVYEGRLVGLWVVAHIAGMYGMRVELSRNIFGGTTAAIVIPPTLLHETEDATGTDAQLEAVAPVPEVAEAELPSRVAVEPPVRRVAPALPARPAPALPPAPTSDAPGEQADPAGELPPLPKRPAGTASMAAQLRAPRSTGAAAPAAPAESATMAAFLTTTQAIRAGTAQPGRSGQADDGAQPGNPQGGHHDDR